MYDIILWIMVLSLVLGCLIRMTLVEWYLQRCRQRRCEEGDHDYRMQYFDTGAWIPLKCRYCDDWVDVPPGCLMVWADEVQ